MPVISLPALELVTFHVFLIDHMIKLVNMFCLICNQRVDSVATVTPHSTISCCVAAAHCEVWRCSLSHSSGSWARGLGKGSGSCEMILSPQSPLHTAGHLSGLVYRPVTSNVSECTLLSSLFLTALSLSSPPSCPCLSSTQPRITCLLQHLMRTSSART